MGRIDEALLRSNVDVGCGTQTPVDERSPWLFESRERNDGGRTDSRPIENGPALTPPPAFDPAVMERLVVAPKAGPLLVEQFRSLAATLHRIQREQPLASVMVTSASPGDGKSLVAINLALTLSTSYQRRVVLIDADLRRPSLHRMFGIANATGLSEALKTTTDGQLPGMHISSTLTLLPAGRPDANPLGGLSSDRMKHIVENAATRFDWVIVDSPPVGVLADGRLVSEKVDAALLVVRAGVTRFADLEAAADTLGRERILGIVLNAVDPAVIRGENYYRHYYGSEPDDGGPAR